MCSIGVATPRGLDCSLRQTWSTCKFVRRKTRSDESMRQRRMRRCEARGEDTGRGEISIKHRLKCHWRKPLSGGPLKRAHLLRIPKYSRLGGITSKDSLSLVSSLTIFHNRRTSSSPATGKRRISSPIRKLANGSLQCEWHVSRVRRTYYPSRYRGRSELDDAS